MRKNNNKVRVLLALISTAAITLIGIGLAPLPASATTLDSAWQAKAVAFWDANGVAGATQTQLLAAYRSVGYTDAEVSKSPVSTANRIVNGVTETVTTYADGSIEVGSIVQPIPVSSNAVHPDAVLNCQEASYTAVIYYTNCNVTAVTPLIAIGFYASFALVQGAYNDQITNKGSAGYEQCTGGTCTKPVFDSWKQNETSSGRAYLRYRSVFSNTAITSTNYVRLLVGNNSFTSDGS